MSTSRINVNQSINHVRSLLKIDTTISPALRAAIETIILALSLLMEKQSKNSKNSHKAPSTDFTKAPAFPRKKKKRTHSGNTIKLEKPDKIILHKNRECLKCGEKLNEENLIEINKRQEIDIIIKKNVIEHQVETMICYCGKISSAEFPEHISRPVQYSSSIKAKICYLSIAQLIPYNRIALNLKSTANINLSEASIFNFLLDAYNRLEFWEEETRDNLLAGDVLNVDETGMTVNKKNNWVHSYSNQNSTILKIIKNRGGDAPIKLDILPHYKGTIVHDCWPTYFKFENNHALCGAHLIRELNNAFELPGQSWARSMKKLLQQANNDVNKNKTKKISVEKYKILNLNYDGLINLGKKQTKLKKIIANKKGRTKEEKAKNLVLRLEKHKESVLRFAKESKVPFTNNLAERDLRMSKVKQKISGSFRSIIGAQIYCRLRSYLLTQQKRGEDPLTAFKNLFGY